MTSYIDDSPLDNTGNPFYVAEQDDNDEPESVSMIMKGQTINYRPKKLIDFVDGFLVLALHNPDVILYFDVRDHMSEDRQIKTQIVIKKHELRQIALKKNKRVLVFPELTSQQSCIVIEDKVTH